MHVACCKVSSVSRAWMTLLGACWRAHGRLSGLLGGACCDPGGRARAHALLVIKAGMRAAVAALHGGAEGGAAARAAHLLHARQPAAAGAQHHPWPPACAPPVPPPALDCLELCVVVCGGVWWPLHDRHSHAKRLKHCLVWSAVVLLRGGCCDGAGECRCTSVCAVGIDLWLACGRLCVRACVNNTFQLQCRGCTRQAVGVLAAH